MDLVTHSVLVMSAVALTLGLLYLRFWISQVERTDFIYFAMACFWVAVYSWFEMAIMNTDSTYEIGWMLWWASIPAGFTIIAVASFLYRYLSGRKWLFWTVVGLRTIGLVANLFLYPNIYFRSITRIDHVTILREPLSIPIGEGSPWAMINQASLVLFLIFSIDSMIKVWRRGDRRKAIMFGGGVSLFVIYAAAVNISITWFPTGLPLLASPAIIFVVLSMGYELNYDMHRSARLANELSAREAELRESIEQLHLSASAADVGVWIRSAKGEIIWASDKWYELFELEPSKPPLLEEFLARVEPHDELFVEHVLILKREVGEEFEIEFRLILKSGEVRWIRASGKTDMTPEGLMIIRGASVDITKLKLAQEAAHELSRKLMSAQEKERARLARELHDDLSQSLALLSIQLHSIASKSADPNVLTLQLGNITAQIDRLSSDVHRISHELHPAKLEQLGLVSALRGLCREISAACGFKVDFRAANIQRSLPNDVSLCLYRVAQESLQNVAKHSGASNVQVKLELLNDQLGLTVSDNGCGFDVQAGKDRECLGLVSMGERLKAVDGNIHNDTIIGSGTRIVASVPLHEESQALAAAGVGSSSSSG